MPSTDFWVGPQAAPDTYRLVTLLGGGGEGEVWQAVLPLSAGGRSTVAVKILHAGGVPDEEQRWEQFGNLLRSLSHPGLVRVTNVFTGPQMHRATLADPRSRAGYVVMDHIEGPTLREWCDENPDATASRRLGMLRMVAAALDEMHSGVSTQVPVAHGDVKPANVVVRDGGGTVLVDLGLARLTDAVGVSGHSTPYAAPELRRPGTLATPEADRYAFAVTTAQVLTGQPPPTGADGWLDRPALESLLRASPVTARRPLLVRQILEALAAPPEARPRQLRVWLDSASDTLSQVTLNGEQGVPASQTVVPPPEPTTDPFQVVTTYPPTVVPPSTAVPPPIPARRRRRWPLALVATLVTVLVGTGLTVYVLRTPAADNQTPSAAAPVVSTTTPPPSPPPSSGSSTTSSAAGTTSAGTTSSTGLPTSSEYLTARDPVDSDRRGHNGSQSFGTFKSSGVQYGHAVSMGVLCENSDGGDYWVDYDLARSWKTFTTTVGLRDDSPATANATYSLILDNNVVATGPLALGTATPIDVPVTGVLRLRLKINNPSAGETTCDGNLFRTQVVWGDPKLNP